MTDSQLFYAETLKVMVRNVAQTHQKILLN